VTGNDRIHLLQTLAEIRTNTKTIKILDRSILSIIVEDNKMIKSVERCEVARSQLSSHNTVGSESVDKNSNRLESFFRG
jgi:hypothetical protein